ncbi:MAG: hypothetical protein KDJ31_12215 [Candidatus Competibacteraceae bacterium]|nr:hypothetical protein [Candidatus Competibacteraceae bacterium]
MKLIKTLLMVSAFVLLGSTPFITAQAEKGVKCDDQKQICRDRNGPSVEQTRQRYGDQAAQRLEKRLSRKGEGDGQQSGGRQGGGQQGGGKQGGGQQGGGKQGGGKQGGGQREGGQKQSGDVFSPLGGVRCVRSEQVCYHYNQPDYQFTQQYFGPAAAGRLNDR